MKRLKTNHAFSRSYAILQHKIDLTVSPHNKNNNTSNQDNRFSRNKAVNN